MAGTTRSASPSVWLCTAALLFVVGCGSGSPSPRITPGLPSLTDDPVTSPATAAPRPPTAAPTIPTSRNWPSGWDTEFCAAFSEVVIAQELAVDVGRALDEDARDDALALANELSGTSTAATEMLAELPEWRPAQQLVERLTALMDLGQRMGRHYRRYIEEDREQSLERAQGFGADMGPVVEDALAELDELAEEEGLSCADEEFALEAP